MGDGERGMDMADGPREAGERLRAARVAQGLDLVDIAQRTRIPQRHIESIEGGDYAALPSVTYAVGFARAYARAVGEDEVAIAAAVRASLSTLPERRVMVPQYEVQEGARTPSRGLVAAGAVVALLLVGFLALYYGTDVLGRRDAAGLTTAATEPAPAPAPAAPVAAAPAPNPAPAPAGQVTLAAIGEVWVRVSDAGGTAILQRTLAPGERFDIPRGTAAPVLNVGRPDQLAITVDGRAIPPLGDGSRALSRVSLEPSALLARVVPGVAGDDTAAGVP